MTHLPIKTLLLLATAFPLVTGCGGAPSPVPDQGFKTITFPNGNVKFFIPDDYSQQNEPNDTVAVSPGENSGIVLRFNLHQLPAAIAGEFVAGQAKEKGLEIDRVGNKSMFSEASTRKEGGRDYDMTFWQIGFGDSLVVMSAETDPKLKEDKVVVDCVSSIPAIIESLHKP